MNQHINIEAIIIGRKNWGEADRLVFAYSKEHGKIKFVARGVRKLKSKLAAHLEPFTIGKYNLVEGKSHLVLIGAEAIYQNQSLSEDLSSFSKAGYLCELLNMLSDENVPNQKIYSLAKTILRTINTADECHKKVLVSFFEFILLESSGYHPNYQTCIKCQNKLFEQEHYYGSYEGVYCENCGQDGQKIDKNTLKMLRMFEHGDLNEIERVSDASDYCDSINKVVTEYLLSVLPNKPKAKYL